MVLPSGITKGTVTFGETVDFVGNPVATKVTFQPSATLFWAATGTPVVPFLITAEADAGQPGSVSLPHTDQSGFVDGYGDPITGWSYVATGEWSSPNGKVGFRREFALPVGATVDLDTVPGVVGSTTPPSTIGPPGPPGPQGNQGEAGISSTAARYEWKTNTAATDPAHGFIKANNTADTTLLTELYVSVYDKNGEALLSLLSMQTGDVVFLYESGQIGTWNSYELTAPPTLFDSPPEWATIPVVFTSTGAHPFTPGGNTQVLFTTPLKGEKGDPGPQGPTILTGTGAPTGAVGAVGQFYLDTAASVLYGPKGVAGEWPVALRGVTDV